MYEFTHLLYKVLCDYFTRYVMALERSRVTLTEVVPNSIRRQNGSTSLFEFFLIEAVWITLGRYFRLLHVWTFQHGYIMCEVMDMHCRTSAIWAFVFKKYIIKWQIISLDKPLIPQLGSCRAFWSCIETAVWTFNTLGPIEVHYMEKTPGKFSLIYFRLKKGRHEHLGWHGDE